METNWIVAQIGAREHYAVPRALYRRKYLRHLYTDAWCYKGQSILRRFPEPVRSFANRFHPEIPSKRVTAFNFLALWNAISRQISELDTQSEKYYQHHTKVGSTFASKVRDHIFRGTDHIDNTVFFGYNTGALEVIKSLKNTNCISILDQIDPGPVHKKIILEEAKKWGGWQERLPVRYAPHEERIRKEWRLADAIVVNSEWSKRALIEENVPANKITVVPLAYESSGIPYQPQKSTNKVLEVLWLGSVSISKGIQYLVEAAKLLGSESIRFNIVGSVGITEHALEAAPANMFFRGRVARDQTSRFYRRADLYVLPTLSDGFAITQLEAMAHGLPVITTPNCGRVVTNGEDGFIIPPRDPGALAEAIMTFARDRSLLVEMSQKARSKAQTFTLQRVADRLEAIAHACRGG